MARAELQRASEELEAAIEHASDDVAGRLQTHAEQLASLATADRGPDHGRLARHMNALHEIGDDAESESVVEHVERALEEVTAYRETVPGV